tara:strand:- start:1669 stop:2583 length:915 start_codon:yes stop_codon:yes gene_type:complete
MTYKNSPKLAKKFYCKCCDYGCSKESDFKKHQLTRKHKILTNTYKNSPKLATAEYVCECGKKYKHRQSLNNHKQKCVYISDNSDDFEEKKMNKEIIVENNESDNSSIKELFLTMMNENKELRSMLKEQKESHDKQISEIIPKIGNTNNSFNIQIFLNENCKDALNINDFLEGIQLQITDLDKMKELGYVNGLTRIFMNGLNQLELTKRPLHCSDAKREILYVKENDAWEKDSNKMKLNNAISTVGRKTLQHFPEWMKNHPDCKSSDSNDNSEYHNLIKSTVAQNTEDNKKKVAKNIIKEVLIDK